MARNRNSDFTFSVADDSTENFKRHPVQFHCKMSICVLNAFMGNPPDFASVSGTELESVEGSILTHARLELFITTTVACLRSNGTDKVGVHL